MMMDRIEMDNKRENSDLLSGSFQPPGAASGAKIIF
jgi:hypothetical protein